VARLADISRPGNKWQFLDKALSIENAQQSEAAVCQGSVWDDIIEEE
jgi:hypothetical protein